jgi:hypothetical protein
MPAAPVSVPMAPTRSQNLGVMFCDLRRASLGGIGAACSG